MPASILLDEEEQKLVVEKNIGKDAYAVFWPPREGFGELGNVWGSELAFCVGLLSRNRTMNFGNGKVTVWPWCIVARFVFVFFLRPIHH